jgi:FkbM family methyltransferase
MSIQSLAVRSASLLPRGFKRWLHRQKMLDVVSRRLYGSLVSGVATVESGPLAGLSLQAGPHISHAHIRGTYEIGTQQAIAKTVQSGWICYDVGASVGYLTLLMARKASHVFSFEPAPHAAAVLAQQVEINGFKDRVTLVPNAVSDVPKTVHFRLTDNAYGSRIVETGLEVKAISLDDFAAANGVPNFIKMDIEGEELRALQGARKLLRERPALCIEIHSSQLAVEVNKLLSEYNYYVELIEDSGLSPYTPGEARPGDVQVLCTPKAARAAAHA